VPDGPLSPCPCCGWPARLTHVEDPDDFEVEGVRQAIECTNVLCGLEMQDYQASGTEALTKRWNQRVK
jgi:hypothetical protein